MSRFDDLFNFTDFGREFRAGRSALDEAMSVAGVSRDDLFMVRDEALATSRLMREALGNVDGLHGSLSRFSDEIGAGHRALQDALRTAGIDRSSWSSSAIEEATRKARLAGSLSIATHGATALSFPDLDQALVQWRDQYAGVSDAIRSALDVVGKPEIHGLALAAQAKMSILAGARDLYGFDAAFTHSALHDLIGNWRTHPHLPSEFWNDREYRQRSFREADADEWLVEATTEEVVEIAVESGLIAGRYETNGTTAMMWVPGTSIEITIRQESASVDGYKLLKIIETRFREFVLAKMEARYGKRWMKARHSSIYADAKMTRDTASKSGETQQNLIAFTNLGDLKQIIIAEKNWLEVFGKVFPDRRRFDHDMDTIIAFLRRPVAHVRDLEGFNLFEVMCVTDRLFGWIDNDGFWKELSEQDY